ncbi:MAG: MFS general substrate transporter [Lasallia pustulata]|uniref:MFS general substrate transporter n=1 Tax=Lasallia pustulata TaxID=136370 RepID=A0A5M8PKP0_9LECA|nr:MAG: MFS general substrate transporter [Lasallia pustulata]
MAVRGWSPASAGSILIPTNAGFALGGLVVGLIHIRRNCSFYIASITAYFPFPLPSLLLAHFSTPPPGPWLYIIATFLDGFVTGAGLNCTLAHILHLTPSSTISSSRRSSPPSAGWQAGFGSAAGGSFFLRLLRSSLEKGFEADAGNDRQLLRRDFSAHDALKPDNDVAGQHNGIDGVLRLAAVAPRPKIRTSNESAAARTGPARMATTPVFRGVTCWPNTISGTGTSS